jgi:hypothetical protein
MPQLLLISGVPCTGKTLLGSYLADEHGYIHIDAERNNGADFDRTGIHREWDEFLHTGRGNIFVDAAVSLGKPMILNWGMPMNFLPIVPALQAAGMGAWWLRADRALARIAFTEREKRKPERERIPGGCFDAQMDEIEKHWPQVQEVFQKHMVQGLSSDGSQRPAAELWDEIAGRSR